MHFDSKNLSKELLFDSGMRIEINTGYSCYLTAARRCQGQFFLVDLGPGAAVGGMWIEINTGYGCYFICNNSRRRMALQSISEFRSYSLFSVILVFAFAFSHVFVMYLPFLSLIWLP